MKKKIVCIGNSITNGFPFKRSQSFPSLIRETTGYNVINKGVNGESTAQVLDRFQHDVIDHKADIVTILTGTNDFIFSLDTVAGAFEKIKAMTSLASKHQIDVLLMTPLLTVPEMAREAWMADSDVDYYKVNQQLEELGELIKGEINDQSIIFLDLQEMYKGFVKSVGSEKAFHDGLHPTVEGQAFIADCILKGFLF